MVGLLLVAALGAFSNADEDSVDLLAPYLGVTPLDAEDLVGDARDGWDEPDKKRLRTKRDGPLWVGFVPTLHLTFEYRDLETTGLSSVHFTSTKGFVFFVSASFDGVSGTPGPGIRQAQAERTVPAKTETPESPIDPRTPTVTEVQEAAERASLVRLSDMTGWRTRARAAAWLPSLEADYRRNVGEIDTLGVESNLGIDSHNLEDVTRYGVKASWQLSQLVFSSEEITAASTAVELEQRRQELVTKVTELYFERLRALAKARDASGRDAEALALKAAELTAKIDALTGNFLSQRLKEGAATQSP